MKRQHCLRGLVSFLLVTVVMLLSPSLVEAEGDTGEAGYANGGFAVGTTVPLFADQVNLRAGLGTGTAVLATLPMGTEVKILARDETTSTIREYTQSWYRVAAPVGGQVALGPGFRAVEPRVLQGSPGKTKEGWIWGGFLAIAWGSCADGTLLIGITGQPKDRPLAGEARLRKDGRVVASSPVPIINTPMGGADRLDYTVRIAPRAIPSLPRFRTVWEVGFIYEACGYTNGEALVFWDGQRLTAGPVAEDVSEAGLFHVESEFLFPGQEGIPPDQIRVKTVSDNEEEKTTATTFVTWRWTDGAWKKDEEKETD
jgi:hypothetical protein